MKLKIYFVFILVFSFSLFSGHALAQINCCKKPDSLIVTSVTDHSFCVSWHKTDSIPCDSITSGTFRYRIVGTTTWHNVAITYSTSNTITFCDTATTCNTYEWQVRNNCKKGDTTVNSGYKAGPNFTTICVATCCKVPDSLRVTSLTDSSFCFSWYVKDSIPCDTITRTILNYRKVGASGWKSKSSSYGGVHTRTFCDTASSCTQYEWRVRNECTFRDSTFNSNWVYGNTFTTLCDTQHLIGRAGVAVKVYPNPARGSITLTGTYASARNLLITVSDMTGTKRIERKTMMTNKSLNLHLDISRLPKGVYFVTISDGKTTSKVNFIKED